MAPTHALDAYRRPLAFEIAPLGRVRSGVIARFPGRGAWPALAAGDRVAIAIWTPAPNAVSSFDVAFAVVVAAVAGSRLVVAPAPPDDAYVLALASLARGMDS
ncbi:MAG TPA: hypothetical protein VM889_04780 [Candidatus Thermoplasmatota archaeon]|nr:hypothetical protein [Candidatus Thermoplasmatota archaeon]